MQYNNYPPGSNVTRAPPPPPCRGKYYPGRKFVRGNFDCNQYISLLRTGCPRKVGRMKWMKKLHINLYARKMLYWKSYKLLKMFEGSSNSFKYLICNNSKCVSNTFPKVDLLSFYRIFIIPINWSGEIIICNTCTILWIQLKDEFCP